MKSIIQISVILTICGYAYAVEPNEILELRRENVKLRNQIRELQQENIRLKTVLKRNDVNSRNNIQKRISAKMEPPEEKFYGPIHEGQIACLKNRLQLVNYDDQNQIAIATMWDINSKPYMKPENGKIVSATIKYPDATFIMKGIDHKPNAGFSEMVGNTELWQVTGTQEYLGVKCFVLERYKK